MTNENGIIDSSNLYCHANLNFKDIMYMFTGTFHKQSGNREQNKNVKKVYYSKKQDSFKKSLIQYN